MQLDSMWAEIAKEPCTSPGERSAATNMAYCMFTSGSTGRPKGTMIHHNSVINYLLGMVKCARSRCLASSHFIRITAMLMSGVIFQAIGVEGR